MNGWDILTWASVAVLGPGSVVIFVFFMRDVRKIWRAMGEQADDEER